MGSAVRTAAACYQSVGIDLLAEKLGLPPIKPIKLVMEEINAGVMRSLEIRIAQARAEMGEDRWAELNAEWETF